MFDIRKIQEQALFNAVEAAKGADAAAKIVYGEHAMPSAEDDATWVKSAMRRLEEQFDPPVVKQLRMNCQCGYGMDEKLTFVKDLMQSSASLEEFANQPAAMAAGLSCQEGELYLQFSFCPCPILADIEKLDSYTWCQCTTGYSKVLFEQAFGCEVEVELLKSVKAGDAICLMKIIPCDVVWK